MGTRDNDTPGPSSCGCKVKGSMVKVKDFFDPSNLVNQRDSEKGCRCLDIAKTPSQEGHCPVHGAVALAVGHGIVHRFDRKIGDR